mgnify:CR=1 FL=1
MATYNKASKYSDASADSMGGVIRAQIILGNIEEARSSLEFLTELSSTMGQSAVSGVDTDDINYFCLSVPLSRRLL